MRTIDAAQGRWHEILPHFNLRITGNKHIPCPLCERKGSQGMRINEHASGCGYICVCGNGSVMNLLMEMTGKAFKEIAKEIDDLIGNVSNVTHRPKLKGVPKKIAATSRPINGTASEYYLKNRGIINLPTMSVHHCDNVPYFNADGVKTGEYPAMVATVTDALTLDIIQQHITYLNNGNKIERKVRNLTDVQFNLPVIRLMDAEKTLGIAEGIETALSASDKYGYPCWATINSGFMKRFRAPLGVTKLIIFADNDRSGTGHAAAFECARANLAAKNDISEVSVVWPDELGDFNDLEDPENICQWQFSKS